MVVAWFEPHEFCLLRAATESFVHFGGRDIEQQILRAVIAPFSMFGNHFLCRFAFTLYLRLQIFKQLNDFGYSKSVNNSLILNLF